MKKHETTEVGNLAIFLPINTSLHNTHKRGRGNFTLLGDNTNKTPNLNLSLPSRAAASPWEFIFFSSLPAGSTICSSLSLAKPVASTANLVFNLQQSRPIYLLQPLTTDPRPRPTPQTDLHPFCSPFPLSAAHRPDFPSAARQLLQKPTTATTDRSEDHPAERPQSHQHRPHR